jgi:hypothetical protein
VTVLNVLVYLALIIYILFRRVQGQPVKAGRKLFLLPVLLVALGYGDVTQGATMKPIEIALTLIGGVVSLGLGLLRGRADKLSERDGYPFVQWGAASLILFVGNLGAKLVLDLIGIASGSTSSVVGKSLLLTFGLTLLGEAIVLWMRTGDATRLLTPPRVATAQSRQPSTGRSSNLHDGVDWLRRQIDQPTEKPTSSTTSSPSLAEAIEHHHNHHHHDHRHDHRRAERERS